MLNNGLTKYAEKYFDAKFRHLHEEIKDVKSDIQVIKLDMKKNGKCLHDMEKVMAVYKIRVRNLTFMVIAILIVMILGVFNGVELVTKGLLGFL